MLPSWVRSEATAPSGGDPRATGALRVRIYAGAGARLAGGFQRNQAGGRDGAVTGAETGRPGAARVSAAAHSDRPRQHGRCRQRPRVLRACARCLCGGGRQTGHSRPPARPARAGCEPRPAPSSQPKRRSPSAIPITNRYLQTASRDSRRTRTIELEGDCPTLLPASSKARGAIVPNCNRTGHAMSSGAQDGSIDQMSRSLMQLAAASPGPGAEWRKN